MNSAKNSDGPSIPHKYVTGSRGIDNSLALVDAADDVRVAHRRRLDQVHASGEERLQYQQQGNVVVEPALIRNLTELDQEVEVAGSLLKAAARAIRA